MNDAEIPAPPAAPPIIAAVTAPETPPRGPWGFWGTAGLGVALISIYIFSQLIVTVGYLLIQLIQHQGKISVKIEAVAMDGDMVGVAVLLGSPIAIFFTGWFIKLRQGPTLADYLGLHWPSWRTVTLSSLGMVAVLIGSEGFTLLIDRPTVSDVMADVYRTANFKPLLWLSIVLLGPIAEEVIFRGFLFQGWSKSQLGGWGAIILTSVAWAIIHLQYNLYGVAIIFAYGIFLGLVRLRTGSVLLCAVLHCLMNLIATIQMELYLASL